MSNQLQSMTTQKLKMVALIPARAGSKRVTKKNIRLLQEHPLIAYSIASALESQIFTDVIVSTDSSEIAEISALYGAEIPFLRPLEMAQELSQDIEWVSYTLRTLAEKNRQYDCFSILRPTSPFRTSATIRRAWEKFNQAPNIDSLRAVEKCKQHPGKMWLLEKDRIIPFFPSPSKDQPYHSMPYQALPEIYVQNASLEMAWTRVVFEHGTIAGTIVLPFFTEDYEGLDINELKDWWYAEHLLQTKQVILNSITPQTG